MEEVFDLDDGFKVCFEKYRHLKILYDTIYECIFGSDLVKKDLRIKIQAIMLEQDTSHVLKMSNKTGLCSNNILGVTQTSDSQINFEESLVIRNAVMLLLQKKYDNICQEYCRISGMDISFPPCKSYCGPSIDTDCQAFLEIKQKCNQKKLNYASSLLEQNQLYQDLLELRLEKSNTICDQKTKHYENIVKMNNLKIDIIEKKIKLCVFAETNNSLSAYKELIKDIKKQQQDYQIEIQHLRKLADKYQNISCKEFNSIVTDYLHYKSSIQLKKQLFAKILD